ncbi:MFS transporter [Tepidiforma sp.]|uniref:MFS transporter n=1 Tax=Tepidiforma sp. TaxID=2682230 RepID=UPI002ADE488E|nr:MFS transporter [Tepidiforma sp.]
MPGAAAVARRNVRLYYAFIALMDFGLWFGIWIKYLVVERGLELKYVLLMDLPFWFAVAALEAPMGALADRIGHSRVLALGAAVYAATILGFGLTTNYWMLFADYMLWAVAQACRSGADQAVVFDSLKAAGRESEFTAIAGRGFALTMGAGLGGIILGGVVAALAGMAFTVQVSAVTPLGAMAAALAMREPRVEHVRRGYLEQLKTGFGFAWSHGAVRATMFLSTGLMMATFAPVVLVQPFLIVHDVPTGLFGVFQAPVRVAGIIGALVAWRAARLLGRDRVVGAACAAAVLAYAGLAAWDALGAFALFALPAVVQGLVRPVLDTYVNELTPSDRRATVLSTVSLLFSLQVGFLEATLGFITDDVSIRAAFGFTAVFFGMLLPPLFFGWRRSARAGAASRPAPAAAAG